LPKIFPRIFRDAPLTPFRLKVNAFPPARSGAKISAKERASLPSG
jgi:hypothetical protein